MTVEYNAAIRHLSQLYVCYANDRRHLYPFVEEYDDPAIHSTEYRKAVHEFREASRIRLKAKLGLLASGFDVPNSWLTADRDIGGPSKRWRRHKDGTEQRTIEYAPPDLAHYDEILKEMSAALLRLKARATAPPEVDGPVREYVLRWNGIEHDLEGEIEPKAWNLLCCLWGRTSTLITEIAETVWKSKRIGYKTMKPTVTRLNNALQRAKLGNINWTKKRGENVLIYNGPPINSSVSH